MKWPNWLVMLRAWWARLREKAAGRGECGPLFCWPSSRGIPLADWCRRGIMAPSRKGVTMSSEADLTAPRAAPLASGYQIRAVAKTDDNQHRVRFDAAGWFAAASEADAVAMHAAGYRGADADAVAYLIHDADPKKSPLKRLFGYLNAYKPRTAAMAIIGFEVVINPADVFRWLTDHRPALAAALFPGGAPESRRC